MLVFYVINFPETLRKYPPLPIMFRVCTQDYAIPDSHVVLKKGQKVAVSILGMHRDPDYFPDPDVFDPERFSPENKDKMVPYSYLPFGEGPRICIGMRFGMMQTKVALTILLKHFLFTLNSKTKLPVTMDSSSFILSVKGDVWLNLKRVD